jgi:EGF domain
MIYASYLLFFFSEIDECQTNNGGCDVNAACTNDPPGSFTCACLNGYEGNGFSCTGG